MLEALFARIFLDLRYDHGELQGYAPSPMRMVCIYLQTSIFISQWDRDRTLTLPVTYGPVFWNSIFPRICLSRQRNFPQKSTKNYQFFFEGLPSAPPPYEAAPLPPNKVGAKCLAAVVLDNQDRALRLITQDKCKYSKSHVGLHFRKFFQSSKLKVERLFSPKHGKRDVQAWSSELWNSIQKCHPKWDWL